MKFKFIITTLILTGSFQISSLAQSGNSIKMKGFEIYISYDTFFHDVETIHGLEFKVQRYTGKFSYGVEGEYYFNGFNDKIPDYRMLSLSNPYLQGLKLSELYSYGFNASRIVFAPTEIININLNMMAGLMQFKARLEEYEYVDMHEDGSPAYLAFISFFPKEQSWVLRPSLSSSINLTNALAINLDLGYQFISDEFQDKSGLRGVTNSIGLKFRI